jgi:hypothetical protein
MKRTLMVLVVTLGIALVVGSGVWATSTLARATNHTASEVVVSPQLGEVPKGSVSTGDGSTAR